ncbi:MAG: hypothetical protein ACJ76H_15470 [Bacteriovoracaceae bacterium]
MKFITIIMLMLAQAAFALPVVCNSNEKNDKELPLLQVKINDKTAIRQGDQVYKLYVLGVVARDPFEDLHVLYGTDSVLAEKIHMTVLKDQTVYGYVDVKSPDKNGIYEGNIRIGGILRSRVIPVTCADEAIHGEI